MNPMIFSWDRTLLPGCLSEVAIISDGHNALPDSPGMDEFPSRGKQGGRFRTAIAVVAGFQADACIHLGDLTQEAPETDRYPLSRDEAVEALKSHGVEMKWVPGNHDVGDKIDPTMAAKEVNEEMLRAFEKKFGPQWQKLTVSGAELFLINSQIFGSSFADELRQKEWLEEELGRPKRGMRFVMMHLPAYIHDPDEQDLGHYDNLPEPARQWFLQLMAKGEVDWVFSGHVHQRFLNFHKGVHYLTLPSPAFTRCGYGHLFSGPAPAEHGRDDVEKMGIILLRVRERRCDIHFVRTQGVQTCEAIGMSEGDSKLLTPFASDLPQNRLGVTLHHPICNELDVPIAWQHSVRQPAHNDYPTLLLQELAPASIRAPLSDFKIKLQSERLRFLQESGSRLEAMTLWMPGRRMGDIPEMINGIEVQIPGRIPDGKILSSFVEEFRHMNRPVRISPVFPHEKIRGKQHARTRYAWYFEEALQLVESLDAIGYLPQSMLLTPLPGQYPGDFIRELRTAWPWDRIRADLVFSFASLDDPELAHEMSAALTAGYQLDNAATVFIEPLRDFDRTMDISNGMIDVLCNPRESFNALKHLNALLGSGHFQVTMPEGETNARCPMILSGPTIREKDAIDLVTGVIHSKTVRTEKTNPYIVRLPQFAENAIAVS